MVVVLEIRDNLFEIVLAERCENLFLILLAHNDVADLQGKYLINFYIEFINRIFYYIF